MALIFGDVYRQPQAQQSLCVLTEFWTPGDGFWGGGAQFNRILW